MVGNAEDFTFSYKFEGETTHFYKHGEKFASVFKAKDMNDNLLTIRELEMEGKVHYIMEDVITSYSIHYTKLYEIALQFPQGYLKADWVKNFSSSYFLPANLTTPLKVLSLELKAAQNHYMYCPISDEARFSSSLHTLSA